MKTLSRILPRFVKGGSAGILKAKKLCRPVFIPVIIIALGFGLILYPKISDWRYAKFQNDQIALAKEKGGAKDRLSCRKRRSSSDKPSAESTDLQPIPEGTVAKLIISKIELDAYVMPGTSPEMINKGPGHYEETPLPGDKGNCAIAGHRTMYGHPFRRLDELEAGDEVVIYTLDKKSVYTTIEKKIVEPTDLTVIAPTEKSRLTLTTCNPVGSARQRLVIVAELEGE